jgi:hypothetical protein
MQFTRVNSNPDETNGLLGVIDKVGLNKSCAQAMPGCKKFVKLQN